MRLKKAIENLNAREKLILMAVFSGRTYEDLSKDLKLTRERTMQLSGKAMFKIFSYLIKN